MLVANRCPVCQARFRGERICSRCGADLTAVMTLAAKSWALRESARLAIEDGEFGQAAEYASESQRLHRTLRGESLMALSEYLKVPPEASATSAALTESEPIPARRTAPYLEVHLL